MFIIMSLFTFSSASAEQFIANVTLKQGERTRLTIPNAYQTILANYGSGYPYSWWSDNTYVCTATSYRSKNFCEIYANSVGTTEIHYKGEYYSGGVHSELTCYWFINVEPSEGGSSSGGGDDATTTDEDYTLPEENWSDAGNYNISWYNKSQTEFNISTNKELAGMAYLINNGYTDFSGKTIKITGDIDLSGKRWLSAGNSDSHCFKGIFDGQNYMIKGLCIGRQNDNQQYYGFFGNLNNSEIRNTKLQGEVIVINPVYTGNSSVSHDVGGLAGYSSSSSIENCRCEMPIKYYRNIQKGGYVNQIHVGGLLGKCTGTTIKYCSHEGDISCIQAPIIAGNYAPGRPYIGGLVGDCSGSEIEYCENVSSIICCDVPRHTKIGCYEIYVGGIVAYSSNTIKHCRSICNFDVIHRGTDYGAYKQFYIGGITSGWMTAVNCYSLVTKANFVYEEAYANSGACEFHYGGISRKKDGIANFSNSDVDIKNSHTLIREQDGSTAYSSTQMRSSAFLEELNMHSILEEDGAVWTQDEDGYPYIAKLHESPEFFSVTSINLDKSSLKLDIGKTQQLVATVFPDSATNKEVCWSSDNTNVATVDNTGLVTAISEGTTTITCSSNDGSGVTATCTVTVIDPNSIYITSANFPDDNFRNWLLESYYGKDGKFTEDEIRNITSLSVNEKNISTLKGIEFFTSLDYLNCSYNQLTSFDLSKNTALTTLYCSSNQLTSLDVTKNTALKYLDCDRNQLTSLDVTKNTALTTLNCSYNQLTFLDLSMNTELTKLFFHENHLSSLDVSKNTALIWLFGSTNHLTSLDLSQNTALTGLQCNRNQINGKAMDELISSLPYNSSDKTYEFYVISPSYDDEGNVCTKNQVAAIKAKGWTAYCLVGNDWQEYEGSDEYQYAKGDVNMDNAVNGTDLVALSNIVLGRKEKTETADVNGDGNVNGTDIVALSNIILGRSNKAPRRTSASGASLSIEDFDIKAGETKEMLIDLTNPNDEVTLVQFDLHLPAGLSIKKSGSDLDFDMAGRTSWRKHTLDANEVDGAYRFLLYSSGNTLIEGASGAIIKVNIVADESFNGGKIVLDNILLVDPNEKETKPARYEYEIGSGSGISTVMMDASGKNTHIYNLSGQKLTAPKKGVNIINGKKIVIR